MHRTGGDIDTRRRDDLVHFTFEDDLTFQTAEVGVVADKIIEFIRVVTMRYLIVGDGLWQIFCLVYRYIDVRVGVRVPVDEDMPLNRQFNPLAERPSFLEASAHDSGPCPNDVFRNVHDYSPRIPFIRSMTSGG